MVAVQCKACLAPLGAMDNFGILHLTKPYSSYHFVLEKNRMDNVEKDAILRVDNSRGLIDGKYFLVFCKNCLGEIGKQLFFQGGLTYLAFGKEKVIYGPNSTILVDSDKWRDHVNSSSFSVFQRFTESDFTETKSGNYYYSQSSRPIHLCTNINSDYR